ncbi:uncharacterized protein B0H18DRAFT_331802 [Fomitopsis serialis]|uniref:uncharacterized protein n=1 Tax=Fomitopsis serialis TaxID=139415 RepID=UPI002008CCBC|nr:uncharacterized protein B0H18DRAFT_331802 [Neoantrodia serialis]KAH9926746.1 hypothetical protein B0H18DRAFT_331802 [Neoantrodia serialis]
MFCHTARDFRAAVASASPAVPGVRGPVDGGEAQHQESLRTVRVVERLDGSAAPGECLLGELTDVGRQVRKSCLWYLHPTDRRTPAHGRCALRLFDYRRHTTMGERSGNST